MDDGIAPLAPGTRETPAAPRAWHPAWVVLMLAVLAGLVYANTLEAPFMLDDQYLFARDPSLRSLDGALATSPLRRLGFVSFALNYRLHGLSLPGYHVTNVLIHFAAAATLFGLARGTLRRCAKWVCHGEQADRLSAAIAAIWLIHPLQTGSVTYVIQRFESLMGLFFLVSLYGLMRSATSPRPWFWLGGSLLAATCAAHTKEVAVVLPVVALAYDRIFLSDRWSTVVRRHGWVHAGYLALSLWIVYQARSMLDPTISVSAGFGVQSITPWEYLRSQAGVLVHYLRLCVWPDKLCLDYYWPVARSFWKIYPAGLFIVSLMGLTGWSLGRRPQLGFLGLCFFAILAPTSSFVPILDLAFEHRMYLPSAAVVTLLVLSAAAGAERWFANVAQRREILGGLLIVVLLSLSARTVVRNGDYSDGIRMWQTVVAASPHSSRAHFMLAVRLSAAGLLDDAEAHYRTSLGLRPDLYEAQIGLGNVRMRQGKLDEAEAYFRQGFAHPRTVPLACANLGRLRERQQRPEKALAYYRHAVAADPRYQQAWEALAVLSETMNRGSEAADAWRRVVAMDPLADQAARRLVVLLATSDDPQVRNIDESIRLAERLNRRTGGRDRLTLECLATAQVAAGRRELAESTIAAALREPGDSASRQRLTQMLEVGWDQRVKREQARR